MFLALTKRPDNVYVVLKYVHVLLKYVQVKKYNH